MKSEKRSDEAADISADLAIVRQLDAVPTLLEVLCATTGMGFAAVARVSADSWTACAVCDHIGFGLKAGSQLDLTTTVCVESMKSRAPVIIEHASADAKHQHTNPRLYGFESYISVPIVLSGDRYFGNLCAIDRAPAGISDKKTLFMFERFARLVALQLDNEIARREQHAALLDERATGELRDQFIAILGHDLRNPLHAVYAMGDMLEKRLTDSVLISMATRIKSSVRRMSELIDNVLDFARTRLGSGIEIQLKGVEVIEEALISVVQELQDAHPERKISFDICVATPVRCDTGRVQQLLSNLVANALTHGSVESQVKVSASATDGDLVLQVWNGGDPIPAESIGKIFGPFWRQSTSAARQGLGLGLHICSEIVRAHGGQLSVTSTSEGGTMFTARLPLADSSVRTVQDAASAAAG